MIHAEQLWKTFIVVDRDRLRSVLQPENQ